MPHPADETQDAVDAQHVADAQRESAAQRALDTQQAATARTDALRTLILSGESCRHAVADHFGINTVDASVISALVQAKQPLSPREIGEVLFVRSGTLTAILDRLERADLIERLPHPFDRRARLIALTPGGEQVLAYTNRHMEGAVEGLNPTISSEAITGLLLEVAARLDASTAQIRADRSAALPDADR